jgi:hypothetical protein
MYWLYREAHEPLLDPDDEFRYWKKYVWKGFRAAVDGYERTTIPRRRQPNETKQRYGIRVRIRRECLFGVLNDAVQGLSYDLAVLQANYAIDRGLLGETAIRVFHDESTQLIQAVRSAWQKGLQVLDCYTRKSGHLDLTEPFREVEAGLQRFMSLNDAHAQAANVKSLKVAPGEAALAQELGTKAILESDIGAPAQVGRDIDRAALARIREAFVTPILRKKLWTRGRWVTESGVSKNSVYDYLSGKRRLSFENRKAMAEAIGLKPEELPD